MTNNYIFRRIRYIFKYNDAKMVSIFALADKRVSKKEVFDWLKKDEDPDLETLNDELLATFLNGWINALRGKKDGDQPDPEKVLNNNIIFRKLRIALNLKDEDVIAILKLSDMRISKPELSSFFRNPKHKNYRECKDQFLRNFIHGMQVKYLDDK